MQPSVTRSHYRPDIDGLRAIAVLAVVLFHTFPEWMNGGFVGVDVFFVISGFLITGIILSSLEKDTFSFATFYARRIKRIFPALIIVLVSSFALGWWCVLPAAELKQLGWHIAGGAGFVSNFVLWREAGYFDSAADTKPLLHLWSLGIEEQFYVVWPMLLWLVHRLRLGFLFVTLAIVAASFASTMAGDAAGTFYSPLSRFWELSLGSGLAYLTLHGPLATGPQGHAAAALGQVLGYVSPRRKGGEKLSDLQSSYGLLLIALAVVLINKDMPFPGWWTLLPTMGTYCILSAGPQARLNRVLSSPALVGIGLISYPLYLWHWPLLTFARIMNGATPSLGMRLCVVLASVVLAWLTYRFVERPIRFGKLGRTKVATLCVLMVLTGLGGLYAYERDGFDFRYPEIIRQLTRTESNDDYAVAWRNGKCFLNPDQSAFDGECVDYDKRPLLFLWGDSHAAAFYAGLKEAQTRHAFGIAQYTASACPPLIHFVHPERPYCRRINDADLERIRTARPDIVLLHADWTATNYDLSRLDDTVAELRKAGVGRIVLLGPVPHWQDDLPRDILAYWRDKRSGSDRPPLRMSFRLVEGVASVDRKMAEISRKLHIEYISAWQAMCNQDGCLTRTAENSTDIMAFDSRHLTPQGAKLLVGLISKPLFGAP